MPPHSTLPGVAGLLPWSGNSARGTCRQASHCSLLGENSPPGKAEATEMGRTSLRTSGALRLKRSLTLDSWSSALPANVSLRCPSFRLTATGAAIDKLDVGRWNEKDAV